MHPKATFRSFVIQSFINFATFVFKVSLLNHWSIQHSRKAITDHDGFTEMEMDTMDNFKVSSPSMEIGTMSDYFRSDWIVCGKWNSESIEPCRRKCFDLRNHQPPVDQYTSLGTSVDRLELYMEKRSSIWTCINCGHTTKSNQSQDMKRHIELHHFP